MSSRDADDEHTGSPIIERKGRLLVLRPHQVPIQSPEGQRWLREHHHAVMAHVKAYPTLRRYLFTDQWASQFLDTWLADNRTLASFVHPPFYMEPWELETGVYSTDYLTRADAGLKFIVAKARKANRSDLIGNLLKGVSVAAEFEIMLAWALSHYFGADAIEPYARIGSADSKTVEFSVRRGGKRLLVEAMILLDDRSAQAEKRFCREHGASARMQWGDRQADANRLLNRCHEKIHQRPLAEPLFLCVNQWASWPDQAMGAEVVGRLLASEIWAQDSMFVGMAYFYSNRLVASAFAEARAIAAHADLALLSEVRLALCGLVAPLSSEGAEK